MMKVFDWGGGSSSNKEDDNQRNEETKEYDENDDIPLICDAVVVRADEEAPCSMPPPPMNPNHVVVAPGAMVCYTNAPQQAKQVQLVQPQTQIQTVRFTTPTRFYGMGRNPVGLQCPYCHRQTITVVQDLIGLGTIVAVFLLAIFFWPICWIPFCIPACHRSHHYCGHNECRQKIGETSVCA